MKKIARLTLVIFFTSIAFIACEKEQSLQEYFIEKQESNNFISFDVPAGVLQLDENATQDTKETLASLKKLNVIAFRINETNKLNYTSEIDQVKNILKNDKFNELVRMKHEKASIMVKYLGTDDAIDEVILFASDQSKGFAVARLLGNKMQPEKIMKLIQNMDELDKNNTAFSQIETLFREVN